MGGGGKGGSCPPGPVEPDISSLSMDLFSLEVDFSETESDFRMTLKNGFGKCSLSVS